MTKSEGDERMGAISFYVSLVSIFILFPYYETYIITSEPGSYPVLVLGNFNKNWVDIAMSSFIFYLPWCFPFFLLLQRAAWNNWGISIPWHWEYFDTWGLC